MCSCALICAWIMHIFKCYAPFYLSFLLNVVKYRSFIENALLFVCRNQNNTVSL